MKIFFTTSFIETELDLKGQLFHQIMDESGKADDLLKPGSKLDDFVVQSPNDKRKYRFVTAAKYVGIIFPCFCCIIFIMIIIID